MSSPDRDVLKPNETRLRMQTIVRLRWFGVLGQLLTVMGVHWGLGFALPVGWCLALIAVSAWVNVALRILYPARHRLGPGLATAVLAYDIAGLTALLALTGGIDNPFTLLIVAPVTVSAATLPTRNTVLLGLLGVAATALLIEVHLPLPWYPNETLALPRLYKLGVLASIVSGMTFLALYAARLSKEARQMSAALAATELVLSREQRLHALDGLAAAAAHELGTPLATISLVTKELQREKDVAPHVAEDIALLGQQADRCREILRKLTRKPSAQDPHHVSLPVTQLIQEAAEHYERPTVRITIDSAPREGGGSRIGTEPVGERRPGLIFGLGNIIENAVDFAESKVEVTARWDDQEITITVADDGPGFSADVMDTIGDPYVTTRPSGQRVGKDGKEGTGLGLGFFIAKTLLERSGAKLSLSNRTGSSTGAAVRIAWPREAFDLRPEFAAGTARQTVNA